MTDHKAEWVLVPRVATQEWRDTVANLLNIGDAEMDNIHAALVAAAPAASEGEDGDAHDVAVWSLIGIAEECGAEKDEGDDGRGSYWTLHLDAMYALEERMRNAVNAMRYAEAETRPAAQVAATPKHDEGRSPAESLRALADVIRNRGIVAPAALEHVADRLDALATQPAARRVTDGPDWRGLYRTQTAMRYMDASPQLSLVDAQRMADEDIQRLESFAQPAEGVSK